MSGTRVPTNPPASYDQRWMQLFWDWVRANRAGYTGTSGLTLTGDVAGTGVVPGTLTSTLGTTGVAAGTYGDANVIPRFIVDAKGRILSATNAGTMGTGGTGGGGFNPWALAGDASGTATTGTLTMALATTGATPGTYGTGGTMVPQVTVDAKGRITAISNVGIAFPAAGGTSTATWTGEVRGTGTIPGGAIALSVGTIAGPFRVGAAGVTPYVAVDNAEASGIHVRIVSTNANGPSIQLNGTGATGNKYLRNSPTGSFEVMNSGYTAAIFGVTDGGTGTLVMMQAGTSTGGFARWGTSSQGLVQGATESIAGTGTYGGVLSTRALRGAIGSSGSQSNAVISPYLNATPVSTTLGGPGTLMSYSLPSSAMAGSGQGMEFTAWGTMQLSAANGGLALRFGTSTLLSGTSTVAGGGWVFEGQIVNQAGSQQQFFSRFALFTNNGVGVEQIRVGTLGMNLSTATPLFVSGTGTASNVRTQLGMTVKFMGLQ